MEVDTNSTTPLVQEKVNSGEIIYDTPHPSEDEDWHELSPVDKLMRRADADLKAYNEAEAKANALYAGTSAPTAPVEVTIPEAEPEYTINF